MNRYVKILVIVVVSIGPFVYSMDFLNIESALSSKLKNAFDVNAILSAVKDATTQVDFQAKPVAIANQLTNYIRQQINFSKYVHLTPEDILNPQFAQQVAMLKRTLQKVKIVAQHRELALDLLTNVIYPEVKNRLGNLQPLATNLIQLVDQNKNAVSEILLALSLGGSLGLLDLLSQYFNQLDEALALAQQEAAGKGKSAREFIAEDVSKKLSRIAINYYPRIQVAIEHLATMITEALQNEQVRNQVQKILEAA